MGRLRTQSGNLITIVFLLSLLLLLLLLRVATIVCSMVVVGGGWIGWFGSCSSTTVLADKEGVLMTVIVG